MTFLRTLNETIQCFYSGISDKNQITIITSKHEGLRHKIEIFLVQSQKCFLKQAGAALL